MNYIETNPYFNLEIENISKADIEIIEDNNYFEFCTEIISLFPETITDCWDENGFIRDEISDEFSDFLGSLERLCDFLISEGYTFKFEDKTDEAWNKLQSDLAKAKAEA